MNNQDIPPPVYSQTIIKSDLPGDARKLGINFDNIKGEIVSFLKQSQRVLLVSHINPDSDAYGSMCGLGLALAKLSKDVELVNDSGVLARYGFMPGVSRVITEPQHEIAYYDGVVILDCGAINRVGDLLLKKLAGAKCIINIDHHQSNDHFGDLAYVVDTASSTSELVFEILSSLDISLIDPNIAVCLFAGLSGDTGSFRFQSTTPRVFEIASELCRRGAKPFEIHSEVFGAISLGALKLQAEALSQIECELGGALAIVTVTPELFTKYGAVIEDSDVLVDRARDIEGVQVACLIRRSDDLLWRISLRSRAPEYDVAVIAGELGGGGHKCAAAFRSSATLEQIKQTVISKIAKIL